ncbi:hypothetical protein AC1031_006068 [Aphanomyces cochlioides]|nr:hypothetical protein AC1031_006068 [Aphanomyces cochlioides]
MYKGYDKDAPAGVISWLGVSEVMGTIDEVVALFRTETTEEYKEYCTMFMKDLLDGQVLYTLQPRTPENPRHVVAIKWFTFASPLPGIAKPRDWCFVETHHDFELDGRRGWTRGFRSINLACCPDLQKSLGLVRGIHHRSGYCFLESKDRPGYLEVHQLVQVDIKGKMIESLLDKAARRRLRHSTEIDTFMRQTRLARGAFLSDVDLVPTSSRAKCYVCQRRFGALSKKRNCRKCGEVVCSQCSQMWQVNLGGLLVHHRVCSVCSCSPPSAPFDANTIVDTPNEDDSLRNTAKIDQSRKLLFSTTPKTKRISAKLTRSASAKTLSGPVSETSSSASEYHRVKQEHPRHDLLEAEAARMERLQMDDLPILDDSSTSFTDDITNFDKTTPGGHQFDNHRDYYPPGQRGSYKQITASSRYTPHGYNSVLHGHSGGATMQQYSGQFHERYRELPRSHTAEQLSWDYASSHQQYMYNPPVDHDRHFYHDDSRDLRSSQRSRDSRRRSQERNDLISPSLRNMPSVVLNEASKPSTQM